jgi:hypothetical protein
MTHDTTTGPEGLSVTVDTKVSDKGDLKVRYTMTPTGPDSIYAGGATVMVTLDRPDFGPNPPKDAPAIAARYHAGIVASIPRVIEETLAEAVSDAADKAREESRERLSSIDGLVKAIAVLLLAQNDGDVETTKVMAHAILNGEPIPGVDEAFPSLPVEVTPDMRADAIAKVDHAIDTMAALLN